MIGHFESRRYQAAHEREVFRVGQRFSGEIQSAALRTIEWPCSFGRSESQLRQQIVNGSDIFYRRIIGVVENRERKPRVTRKPLDGGALALHRRHIRWRADLTLTTCERNHATLDDPRASDPWRE